MNDARKTKAQLLQELEALRQRLAPGSPPRSLAQSPEGRKESAAAPPEALSPDVAAADATAHLPLLMQQVPAVIWSTSRDLVFSSSQGAALAALGLRPGQVVGLSLFDFFQTQDPQFQPIAAHYRALRGESVSFEQEWSGRAFQTHVEPLRDAQRRIIGCIGIALDITQRKQAEEALRQSEERYRALAESSGVGIWQIDPQGHTLYLNPAMRRMLEINSVEEICGQTYHQFFGPHGLPIVVMDRPLRPEDVVPAFETTLLGRRGGRYHVVIYPAPLIGRNGRLQSVIGTVVDLTQRKQAEAQARQKTLEMQALVEALPDLYFRLDADGRIRDYHAAQPEHLYAQPDDFLGRRMQEVLPAPAARLVQGALRRVARSGALETLEYRLKIGDRDMYFEARLLPMPGSQLIMIVRDITGRKQAEAEAQQRQAELAHVARLTTMGEMASGIAHELNQPLAAIANYAQGSLARLEAGPPGCEPLLDALRRIREQAGRAGQIIKHLRHFVRKREPQRATVDLGAVVRSVVALTEYELARAGVELRLELDQTMPAVLADDIQIEQVLVNLVRNALESVQLVEPGRRELVVTTKIRSDQELEVSVRDTGKAISPEVAEQMFNPFFTTKPEGMGMGLTISRSIIEAHGGRLWAMVAPDGRGAVFAFTLPVATPRARKS